MMAFLFPLSNFVGLSSAIVIRLAHHTKAKGGCHIHQQGSVQNHQGQGPSYLRLRNVWAFLPNKSSSGTCFWSHISFFLGSYSPRSEELCNLDRNTCADKYFRCNASLPPSESHTRSSRVDLWALGLENVFFLWCSYLCRFECEWNLKFSIWNGERERKKKKRKESKKKFIHYFIGSKKLDSIRKGEAPKLKIVRGQCSEPHGRAAPSDHE